MDYFGTSFPSPALPSPRTSPAQWRGGRVPEFRVNGKTHSASEVQQLLESAGFSSSNPYYIVQQGKIQNLTTMKGQAAGRRGGGGLEHCASVVEHKG